MKVAVVIGHHRGAKGAFSPHLGFTEFDFWRKVANKIVDLPNVDVYEYEPIRSYTQRIMKLANKINKKDYDLVMELHFNSASPLANGCETLYYFASKKGLEYAKKFSKLINKETGITLRGNEGAKPLVTKNDRGFGTVYYYNAPTILIEPFFGSNASDVAAIGGIDGAACLLEEWLTGLV